MKKMTEAQKIQIEKMASLRKGRKLTDEHRKAISESHKGIRPSLETRKKLSKIAKERSSTPEFKERWLKIVWKGGREVALKRIEIKKAGRPRPDHCEICKTTAISLKKKLHFDHCHTTGKFRGWICSNCNLALGLVKDDIVTLNNMVTYLSKEKLP